MGDFIHLLGGALAEMERHFNLGVQYGLVPSRATSSLVDKDGNKHKQGGKSTMSKDSKSEPCSGCGGAYRSVENCFLKSHDFNKSGPWEKSAALAKLKGR